MTRSLLALVTLLGCTAAPSATVKAIHESWGKPGISFDQYRADSVTCGKAGYYMDVSKTDEAKAFVEASRKLDSLPGATAFQGQTPPGQDPMGDIVNFAGIQQHIVDSVDPDVKMKSLSKAMQATVDNCLVAHGYSRFRLTDAQTKRLGGMKIGSDERRHYLFTLASDPSILSTQREPAPATTP